MRKYTLGKILELGHVLGSKASFFIQRQVSFKRDIFAIVIAEWIGRISEWATEIFPLL